ncbi:MAG: hypothetical protein DLM68_00330 [Hyphomicrobiales bacterium]|nr:MAG: hypothetical protein DLM68_00330 [Hyphomicrobiales bacterium]
MIPAITEGGRSFKGAALYYLHDKRQAGEAERLTSERVAWTHTVNLATDDPERAWRIMAHTAQNQAGLKAAAGVKNTGRKLTKPVHAYSLAWHPDEKPTKEDQLNAARDSLTAQGFDGHQAVILSHNDEPHAHVHILVNRVHPETGIAATLSNSKLKLSEWAQAYEQQQGKILVPQRVENNAKRKQGEFIRAPRVPRQLYEFNRATANDRLFAEFAQTEQRQQDAYLYDAGRQMRTSHARQWDSLKSTYDTVRSRIQNKTKTLKAEKAQDIKARAKGRWRDLFRRQREHLKTFDAAERGTIFSKLSNIMLVYRMLRQQNRQAEALNIFYTLMSSSQRRTVFDAAQVAERRTLARFIRQEVKAAGNAIDRDAAPDLDDLRNQYLGQCGQLRQTQAAQQTELKMKWQVRNNERDQELAPVRERAAKYRQARHFRRGRSIKDDDLYRRPPQKPDPGQGGQGPKMG